MQHKKIPLADTKAFSPFFLDYLRQKESLKPFYHRFPVASNFSEQIEDKARSFPQKHRDVLVATLRSQYKRVKASDLALANIEALGDSKTFTVTTGHQLNIFTGPLYFVYKIVTVINACRELKQLYPDHHFVPVYWMASEDHDYDEIKYFRLYEKKYVWNTDQRGAVGRFSTSDIKPLLGEVPGDITIFKEAYSRNNTLAEATRHYVNALFGNEGLVVVDADDSALKAQFAPVMADDIVQNTTHKLVAKTNEELSQLGYKAQVYCRDINFFYLDDGIRERIEKVGNSYRVIGSDLSFDEQGIRDLIQKWPARLSPNVILRPVYQEWILPNLAYVGGPAENIYWLQLKRVFDNYALPFPMLMPRNFAMIVDHTIQRKAEKTGLDLTLFFEEKNFLFNHWTLLHSGAKVAVGTERETIKKIYDELRERAEAIDKTLGPFAAAEGQRVMNGLEKIERKMLRAEKRHHTDRLRQIEAVKDSLFPNGGLQERTDNFLNFYQRDDKFIDRLLQHLEPFDYQFNILIYPPA